jgi:hypothetical protein
MRILGGKPLLLKVLSPTVLSVIYQPLQYAVNAAESPIVELIIKKMIGPNTKPIVRPLFFLGHTRGKN